MTIKQWEIENKNFVNVFLGNFCYFGFTENEILKAYNSLLIIMNNRAKMYVSETLFYKLTLDSNIFEFYNVNLIHYLTVSKHFKLFYNSILFTKYNDYITNKG
jgi:hypothetical protein